MITFRQKCISLRKRDQTLPEIVRLTGRPKSSVYAHIRGIPLSKRKIVAISNASKTRARALANRRRGISARHFKKFPTWDRDTVLLISHLLFDGEIGRRGCNYNNRSEALVRRVEHLMLKVYAFEPKRYLNQKTGVLRISYYNVSLGDYVGHKAQELLKNIHTMPASLKREFVRAFFDDEGCMDYRPLKGIKRIRGYQKNRRVLEMIHDILEEFEISSSIKEPNEVVIIGVENLKKFKKEIGFSAGVRINGNRSNSIWKTSLEKRELLRRAIASYR